MDLFAAGMADFSTLRHFKLVFSAVADTRVASRCTC